MKINKDLHKRKRRIKRKKYKLIKTILEYSILLVLVFILVFVICIKNDEIKKTKLASQQSKLNVPVKQKPYIEENIRYPNNFEGYKKYNFEYIYSFNSTKKANGFLFKLPIPKNIENVQYIYNLSYGEKKPYQVYKENDNKIAEFYIPEVNKSKFEIKISGTALVRTYDLSTAKKFNKNIKPMSDLSKYLKPEKYIESDDSYVKVLASQIGGNTKEEIVRKIYEYLQKNNFKYILYDKFPVYGAKQILISRQGKCVDYAAAFVALCRARGIPARIISGNITLFEKQLASHAWVEVYFDKYGWVTFEPTSASIKSTFDKDGHFVKKEQYAIFSKIPVNYIKSGQDLFVDGDISYYSDGEIYFSPIINIKEVK